MSNPHPENPDLHLGEVTVGLADAPAKMIVEFPAYVTVRPGKSAETRELIEGRVYADFDADGNLLGVEVIG